MHISHLQSIKYMLLVLEMHVFIMTWDIQSKIKCVQNFLPLSGFHQIVTFLKGFGRNVTMFPQFQLVKPWYLAADLDSFATVLFCLISSSEGLSVCAKFNFSDFWYMGKKEYLSLK